MLKSLRRLPQSLQFIAFALFVAPVVFFALFGANLEGFVERPVWYNAWLFVTYAVLPWLMLVFMALRHGSFLVVAGAECVAVLAGVFVSDEGLPGPLRNLHSVFAMTLVGLSLMLINKDVLFPFLFSSYRGWRRTPRIQVNQPVKLYSPQLDRVFALMIQDCSLSGIALYGAEDTLDDLLAEVQPGTPLVVRHGVGKAAYHVPLQLVWHSEHSSIVKLGLMATDTRAMARFFDGLGFKQNYSGLERWLRAIWGRKLARRMLNYMFAVAFLVVMLLPALSGVKRRQLFEARSLSAVVDAVSGN